MNQPAHPAAVSPASYAPLLRSVADTLVTADALVRRGVFRGFGPSAVGAADDTVPVRESVRQPGSALAVGDGAVKAVFGAWLLTSTRSIRAWPRPNGWLDSRYPDGVDGFQPNMGLVPNVGGTLDTRWPFGGQPVGESIGATDGTLVAVTLASWLGAVNMQIVPTSTGVIDSRYHDGYVPLLPDITPPNAPPALDASVTGVNSVHLAWAAATDPTVPGRITSGVAQYAVRRNGVHLDYTSDLTYDDAPVDGAYTYTVRAVDVAGNVSGDSEPAAVNISTGPGNVLSTAELQAMGFIVVTAAPYSADPTGLTDVTSRLQAATAAAYAQRKSVWVPSGTYLVSRTWPFYRWQSGYSGSSPEVVHGVYGATYPSRPVIRLAPGAAGFQNVNSPRPVVAFALWRPSSSSYDGQAAPTDLTFNPYAGPGANWSQLTANNFAQVFHNIDIDTGRNPGADGLLFSVAQGAFLGNCRIDARSGNVGLVYGGGRSSPAVNVEIEGGRYGVSVVARHQGIGSAAGVTYVGLRCRNQTVGAIEVGDFVPTVVAGFAFERTSGPVVTMVDDTATANRTLVLIDGTIETGSGSAIDDTPGKTLYLRNVWVNGTTSLVKIGATTYSGSGAWKRIHEFGVCDLDGTEVVMGAAGGGSTALAHFRLLDGVRSRVQIAANSIESTLDAAPADLVTRHLINAPTLDGDDYILLPAPGTGNSVNSINAAINSAAAAGHNRVIGRHGDYLVDGTVQMHAHTQLLGCGIERTRIYTHSSWRPTSNEFVVQTASDAAGTARLGFLSLIGRSLPTSSNGTTPYNRFDLLRWRVGRYSSTYCIQTDYEYVVPSYTTPSRRVYTIEGPGGGRHYGVEKQGRGFNGVEARVVLVQSTTQPLHLYGCQTEISKGNPSGTNPEANIELRNATNARIYSMKREGTSPSVLIDDSSNIGVYGAGAMLAGMTPGYVSVQGSSDNVLAAALLVQRHTGTATGYTAFEDLDTTAANGVPWPNGVALYKRGALNDDAVRIA